MPRAFVVLALASVIASGCCMGGSGGSGTGVGSGGTVAPPPPPVVPSGEGLLPTPAPLFAGVDAPYPIVGGTRGTEGYILRSGSATVQFVTGLAGVAVGTPCSYTQYQITHTTLDCRWNVTCGGYVAYGLGTGGYQHCSDPSWPPGTAMYDPNMSSSDTDPSFVFNQAGITIQDDYAGRNGAFTVRLTVP